MADSFEAECSKMRRKVIIAVAHDLKTPLACIIGSLQVLEYAQDKLTIEKAKALIQTALHEARKVEALINNELNEEKA
jgi:K+-sensing histidine kinase KdpD